MQQGINPKKQKAQKTEHDDIVGMHKHGDGCYWMFPAGNVRLKHVELEEASVDITFCQENRKFNYRSAAVIIHDEKILAMHDERSPYYYIPGGRVKMGERAEDAVIREIREELGVEMKILRPLWLNQAFFNEDVSTMDYHELCIYFLMDYEGTDLLERGEKFIRREDRHIFTFEWLEKKRLKSEYFYPIFLKTEILSLPSSLTLRTEME